MVVDALHLNSAKRPWSAVGYNTEKLSKDAKTVLLNTSDHGAMRTKKHSDEHIHWNIFLDIGDAFV